MGRPKGSKNKPKTEEVQAMVEAPPPEVVQLVTGVVASIKRRGRPPKTAQPATAVVQAPVVQPTQQEAGVEAPVKRRGRPPKTEQPATPAAAISAEIPVRKVTPKEITSLPGTKPGLAGSWTNTAAAMQAKANEPKALNEELIKDINAMTQAGAPKKYPAEWAEFRKRANRDSQLIKFLADVDTDQLIFAHECLDAYPDSVNADMTAAIKFLLEEVTGKLLEIKESK
jgi:hypothetical protein